MVVGKLRRRVDEAEIAECVGELAEKRRSSRYENEKRVGEGVYDIFVRSVLS